MLLRIQSLYLLLAAVCSGGLFFSTFLTITGGVTVGIIDSPVFIVLFLFSALLSFISIFLYRSRQTQFVMGRLNIVLNFILLGLFTFRLFNSSAVINGSGKGFGLLLPVFCIVLLALANKAIKKDEELIKSADRLR